MTYVGTTGGGLTVAANGVQDLTAGIQHHAKCDDDQEPAADAHGYELSSAWSGPDDLAHVPREPVSPVRAVFAAIRDQTETENDGAEQHDGTECVPAEGVLPVFLATRRFV